MRHAILKLLACAMALMALSIGWTSSARADRFDDIAASPMSGGRPTAEAAKFEIPTKPPTYSEFEAARGSDFILPMVPI